MHKSLIAVLLLAVIAACAASNPNGNQELLRFAERAERVEQAANVPDTEGSDEDEGAMRIRGASRMPSGAGGSVVLHATPLATGR